MILPKSRIVPTQKLKITILEDDMDKVEQNVKKLLTVWQDKPENYLLYKKINNITNDPTTTERILSAIYTTCKWCWDADTEKDHCWCHVDD